MASKSNFPAPAVPMAGCTPSALSTLGPVLCLHAATDPHLLTGWSRAAGVAASVFLDSDGPGESLHFYDIAGAECWRLQMLPDSDFHAWEKLLACLPVKTDIGLQSARAVRAWPRCAQPRWRACALQLHALPRHRGKMRLAATDVSLSALGAQCLDRVMRRCGTRGQSDPTRMWTATRTFASDQD